MCAKTCATGLMNEPVALSAKIANPGWLAVLTSSTVW